MGLREWRTGFAVLLACLRSERLCLANTFPHYITQALIPFEEHNAYTAHSCQLSDIAAELCRLNKSAWQHAILQFIGLRWCLPDHRLVCRNIHMHLSTILSAFMQRTSRLRPLPR